VAVIEQADLEAKQELMEALMDREANVNHRITRRTISETRLIDAIWKGVDISR
jgi:hypothetical protein